MASTEARPSSKSASETDSFLRRLAGASVNKAGIKKDQTEINKIIAEASKGSKFYEFERKKDEELSKKIKSMLAMRDKLMKTASIPALEAEADRLVEVLESQRDLSQTIVHCDADAFYASVELLTQPHLKGKAFCVGGGVLTTASYEARAYGCRSGMAGFIAKKLCPHLIVVKPDFNKYSKASKEIMTVLRKYDPNMAAVGMDEAFLNITNYMHDSGMTAGEVVQKMRTEVEATTKLTISAGIAPTKCLAKVGSDYNKPNGQFELPFDRDSILAFTNSLAIRKIPGIGKVTERCLQEVGINTCGDIYKHRASIQLLGLGLQDLLRAYLGTTSNQVIAGRREDRKSVGVERTFRATQDKAELLEKLEDIAENLARDLEELDFEGRTLAFKYKLDDFQVHTVQSSSQTFYTKADILKAGTILFEKAWPFRVRLIGLRVTKLVDLRASKSKVDGGGGRGIGQYFNKSPSPQKPSVSKQQKKEIPVFEVDSDEEGDEIQWIEDPSGVGLIQSSQPKEALEEDSGIYCPICSKSLPSDDAALNAHLDACLADEDGASAHSLISTASKPSPSKPTKESLNPKKSGRPSTKLGDKKKQSSSSKSSFNDGGQKGPVKNAFIMMMKKKK